MRTNEALNFARRWGFDSVEYGGHYREYEVFIPSLHGAELLAFTPRYILAGEREVRWALPTTDAAEVRDALTAPPEEPIQTF